MEVIYILIPLALVMSGLSLAAFFWTVRKGHMDDLETPAHRAVFDDER
jgi:cbb3-type cytochrome oxidase maturation protein